MSTLTDITVQPATAADLPAAARVLADAFSADPVMAAIIPEQADRDERLTELFTAVLSSGAYRTGVVDLARRGIDGEIVGVAAWEAPGAMRGALGRQLRELPRFARAIGWTRLPHALGLLSQLDRHRPDSPHWYLGEIGVSSTARGMGVGGRLLRAQLDMLDATRQSAYLESSTPDNRRLYRRAGFVELGEITGIPGARPARMLRAPQSLAPAPVGG
ncbi:GNAT family N-acetyltransferase [Microbacterium sp. SCN 69-37]|uniref:GNAT family N-acetyltransferase n=1 Tax=Microbacterium sp. SCN 69-37 TaxID=1660115 RepID=UPI00086CF2B2|nr:GNAT family N-acetyltransferase [Microbacterium sp. SCN 69-37]ODT25891.1 MAG: GNAT family N-acetyltransferase [Microbacterium sp. SCN 69-37]